MAASLEGEMRMVIQSYRRNKLHTTVSTYCYYRYRYCYWHSHGPSAMSRKRTLACSTLLDLA